HELAVVQRESGGVATMPKIVGYITVPIETLREGDWIMSRDENDPDVPLVAARISKKYVRIADHLQLVGFEDSASRRHLIETTDEHPYHSLLRRWTQSQLLEMGEEISGPAEITSAVTSNVRQSHPGG